MRRQLWYAVLVAAAGAGLAWFGTTRPWLVVEHRVGLPNVPGPTGGGAIPWLPVVALVALAGAGALLALGGTGRIVVGALLGACGLALVLRAGLALVDGARVVGPVLTVLGGLAVIDAGVLGILRGRSWPAPGARYERTPRPAGTSGMWDALDRGEDPTR